MRDSASKGRKKRRLVVRGKPKKRKKKMVAIPTVTKTTKTLTTPLRTTTEQLALPLCPAIEGPSRPIESKENIP